MRARRFGRGVTSIICLALCALLVVGGTFAFTALNLQDAINEVTAVQPWDVDPQLGGGRLHDHFNNETETEWNDADAGTDANKNVFIENIREDDAPIFVRVRLWEELTSTNPAIASVPRTLFMGESASDDWDVNLGGDGFAFIPTDMRDPMDNRTDIRGDAQQGPLADIGTLAPADPNRTLTATPVPNMPNATVVAMADWNGQAGDFWVMDTDGWFYWARPVAPGYATGQLINSITLTTQPAQPTAAPGYEFTYQIHVEAEMTIASMIFANLTNLTPEARLLLEEISGQSAAIHHVTNEAELRAAVAAGGNIIVDNDIELTSVVEINNTVQIASHGAMITVADNHRHFNVIAGGELTLTSGVTLTRATSYDGLGGGVNVSAGTLIMDGSAKIYNNSSDAFGGGVEVVLGSTFIMNGNATIERNHTNSVNGGGVFVHNSSTMIMNGESAIRGNRSMGNGGGVLLIGGSTMTMNGGNISNNTASNDLGGGNGGGIEVTGQSTFNMNGGVIQGNHSANPAPSDELRVNNGTANLNSGSLARVQVQSNHGNAHINMPFDRAYVGLEDDSDGSVLLPLAVGGIQVTATDVPAVIQGYNRFVVVTPDGVSEVLFIAPLF